MPKFTKEQDPRTELAKLQGSFLRKIDAAKKSSDPEQKLQLCKEIIDEYNESIPRLNIMDKYRNASKKSKEIAFKPTLNALQGYLKEAKGIYVAEQIKRIFNEKNFPSLQEQVTTIKEVLSLANAIKNKSTPFKEQIKEATKLLGTLENKQQELAHKQKFTPIANEAAKKALQRDVIMAEKEANQQEFTSLVKQAVEKAQNRNEHLAQVEARQQKIALFASHAAKEAQDRNEHRTQIKVRQQQISLFAPLAVKEALDRNDRMAEKAVRKEKFLPIAEEAAKTAQTKNPNIRILKELLLEANINDSQITDRKYFLEFITTHKASFDVLMANLPNDKKAQFIQDMKPIQNPTIVENAKSTILAMMSKFTSPLTAVTRAIAPSLVDQANAYLPDTQDSYCKAQLKKLIVETLEQLNEAEQEAQRKQEQSSEIAPLPIVASINEELKPITPSEGIQLLSDEEEQKKSNKEVIVPITTNENPKSTLNLDEVKVLSNEEKQEKPVREVLIPETKKLITLVEETQAQIPNLDEQKAKFMKSLEQYKMIVIDLQKKQKSNEKYNHVTSIAIDLYEKLDDAAAFFQHPTVTGFEVFKKFCEASITEAEKEFKNHRDLWHTIHPVLKGILGVVATLTVIPALIVAATKTGYVATFFKTPETTSAKKLAEIKENLENVEDEVEQRIRNTSF